MMLTRRDFSQLVREAEATRQKRNRERWEQRQLALFRLQLEGLMDEFRSMDVVRCELTKKISPTDDGK